MTDPGLAKVFEGVKEWRPYVPPQPISQDRLAEAKFRVATKKRIQWKLAAELITEIERRDEPLPPEPEVRWRKDAPEDRVFFSSDGRGLVIVIDTIGGITEYMSEGRDEVLEELRAHPFPGLWIWEGRVCASKSWTDCGYEYDAWIEGDVRPLTDDERAAVREGWHEHDAPWDRSLWLEPSPPVVR